MMRVRGRETTKERVHGGGDVGDIAIPTDRLSRPRDVNTRCIPVISFPWRRRSGDNPEARAVA